MPDFVWGVSLQPGKSSGDQPVGQLSAPLPGSSWRPRAGPSQPYHSCLAVLFSGASYLLKLSASELRFFFSLELISFKCTSNEAHLFLQMGKIFSLHPKEKKKGGRGREKQQIVVNSSGVRMGGCKERVKLHRKIAFREEMGLLVFQ